jgi:hypothetical protein
MSQRRTTKWFIEIQAPLGYYPLRYPNGSIKCFNSRERAEAWSHSLNMPAPFYGTTRVAALA